MNTFLMHPDRGFDLRATPPRSWKSTLADLAIDTIVTAMADSDPLILSVTESALAAGQDLDSPSVLHRQAVLEDAIASPGLIRDVYRLAQEAIESRERIFFGLTGRHPSTILFGAREAMSTFLPSLKALRALADANSDRVVSPGLRGLFGTLRDQLPDDYFAEIEARLRDLRFSDGVLVSAKVGPRFRGADYILHRAPDSRGWWRRLLQPDRSGYRFTIPDRDETGARALGDLRDRGVNLAANALAQSADHILKFLEALRVELAFFIGGINLHRRVKSLGLSVCYPTLALPRTPWVEFAALSDVSLALVQGAAVVTNDFQGDGRTVVIVTGANQGGKSTFLRSVGQAQVMAQAGLFVTARSFTSPCQSSVLTHFTREEDRSMTRGRFEEELQRLSDLVDLMAPGSLVLLNESFASTNEREGSEIGRQVVSALRAHEIRVFFVTHLYDFARSLYQQDLPDVAFLRAERQADGSRTFRILPGEPLETSFGVDVYREVFG